MHATYSNQRDYIILDPIPAKTKEMHQSEIGIDRNFPNTYIQRKILIEADVANTE